MVQLYGVKGGLQAWYVEWALASAHRLSRVEQDDYFFTFPWHACPLKTRVALMLVGYLATDEAPALLRPRQVKPAPTSVLAPSPAAVSTGVVAIAPA